jgi:hypothetical protein
MNKQRLVESNQGSFVDCLLAATAIAENVPVSTFDQDFRKSVVVRVEMWVVKENRRPNSVRSSGTLSLHVSYGIPCEQYVSDPLWTSSASARYLSLIPVNSIT